MKKLITEALKQHNRTIRDFVTNDLNQDMLHKVFKDLTRKEKSVISTMLFDFDSQEAEKFALAVENHNATISYRYATEKDFQLPKVELSNDVKWDQLWEELIFEKFEDDDFQVDTNDVKTMTSQQLCQKYFPGEHI